MSTIDSFFKSVLGWFRPLIVFQSLVLCVVISLGDSVGRGEEFSKPVFVHYMPWYASKPSSQVWGWHWTMNHFDPEKIASSGRREIASHYYPVIGPYDSGSPELIRYHLQLMKIAGIDGVIIDWYGIEAFQDYGILHRNTLAIVEQIQKAGMKFAICYEDQSLKQMVEQGKLDQRDVLAKAKEVFRFLDSNWFNLPSYVRIDNRPVLLVFGPQYLNRELWQHLTSTLENKPLLFGLHHLAGKSGFDGKFGWPPVSGNQIIPPKKWKEHLREIESRDGVRVPPIAVAFPGFRDIYQEAGLHDSYGSIADHDGRTFEESFELAIKSSSQIIQVATWNDFGEGTMIEPTVETGYRYLEAIQKYKHSTSLANGKSTVGDLRLPAMLYMRKKDSRSAEHEMQLENKIDDLIIRGDLEEARLLIKQLVR